VTEDTHDSDGLFDGGDSGCVDGDGGLFFKRGKHQVTLTGGIHVYPKDGKEVLAGCEGVAECAVSGVADEKSGESQSDPRPPSFRPSSLSHKNPKVGSALQCQRRAG